MRTIPLPRGKVAIVDNDDFLFLSRHVWDIHKTAKRGTYYARRSTQVKGKNCTVRMHHAVIGKPPKGFVVDHINGDGLDNRKANLRFVTPAMNCHNNHCHRSNKTGYRGVRWFPGRARPWRAVIRSNNKYICLGYYRTPEEAQNAYLAVKTTLAGV